MLRGTAQNPTCSPGASGQPFHDAFVPAKCRRQWIASASLAATTGWPTTWAHPMRSGSSGDGVDTARWEETVARLLGRGEKVGLLVAPVPSMAAEALLRAFAGQCARCVAVVLDRCKEPGADGEPLYKDAGHPGRSAAADGLRPMPVIGGRFGLASKEFTPAWSRCSMSWPAGTARRRFTVGIHDDVTHLSLAWDGHFRTDASRSACSMPF